MGPYDDGLEIVRSRIGPDTPIAFGAPKRSAGQFGVVLGGSVVHDGSSYPMRSCFFAGTEETLDGLKSGDDGADLLVARFPVARRGAREGLDT
jgi:hypothetical protein